jgi:hypothetical protein
MRLRCAKTSTSGMSVGNNLTAHYPPAIYRFADVRLSMVNSPLERENE